MDITGWVGSLLVFAGLFRIGGRHRDGFIWAFAGEICWIQRGLNTGLVDLTTLSFIFMVLNCINWIRWGRYDNSK